ncbi:MAG: hypothetical protein KR126chlam1_01484 [Chlamydiae bacterium]|nr:hypothetical protein [Chlamydiota bacterium]
MKFSTSILSAALLTIQFAYSLEQPNFEWCEDRNTRIYIGPDIFWDHFDVEYSYKGEQFHIKSNTFYGGLRIGYDWLKPETLYFGGDGGLAIGRSEVQQRSRTINSYHSQKFKNSPLIANLEQRFGYTFQSPIACMFTLAPFIGAGWYYFRPQFNEGNRSTNWFYAAVGLRGNQQFLENFDIGFHVKGMFRFAIMRNRRMRPITFLDNFWGYEFSLPFTWHVDCAQKWDIQLQPYLLKLDVNCAGQFIGTRIQVGYVF